MLLAERPKKTVAFGSTTNINETLIKDKDREFISQPFTRSKVSSFLGNCKEVAELRKEQSAHKSALVELQNKVSELEANDIKQKNEISVLREKFVELCTIVSGLADSSQSSSPTLFNRLQAPAAVERPILVQKQDRKKEKQKHRRHPRDNDNMSGTNGENSKIVSQYMSVERKVVFSSPSRNEKMRACFRASATQTRRENGSRQITNNKTGRKQSQPNGSVHFDQLSLTTAHDENMDVPLDIDYQLSDSSSYTSDSD